MDHQIGGKDDAIAIAKRRCRVSLNDGGSAVAGGGAGAVPVEQRVRHVADRGEQRGHHAHHVPGAVPHQQGALEPDHRRPRLQRPQDVHGDELEALRRAHRHLQGRTPKVSPAHRAFLAPDWSTARQESRPLSLLSLPH